MPASIMQFIFCYEGVARINKKILKIKFKTFVNKIYPYKRYDVMDEDNRCYTILGQNIIEYKTTEVIIPEAPSY
jgi:hypothetical protein